MANEVAKNLVLAGIGTLTIVDHETVKEEDLGAQFFVTEEHKGQNVGCALLENYEKGHANRESSARKRQPPQYMQ